MLALAYRGYSDSTGEPNEPGLNLDAEAVMKFAHAELAHYYVDKGGIFVIGRSLGGGVATSVISSLPAEQLDQIDGLVLENTFTSIEDMANEIFGVLACLKGFILTNHWRNIDLVKDISLPMFFVTGRYDEIVPT